MYDEYERAVTGKPRQGLSFLAWVGIVVGLLFITGVIGVGIVGHRVASHVERMVEDIGAGPLPMVAEMLSEMEPAMEVLAADPEMGRTILRNLKSGDWDELQQWEGWEEAEIRDDLNGNLRIQTEEGEVTADLRGGREGGFLEIRSPEGKVRLDLRKSDAGGELLIRTPEETVRLGAGDGAMGMPDWVPPVKGMPGDPREVFSARSGKGRLGAVAWESSRSPSDLLQAYQARLEADGFEIQVEQSAHRGSHRTESFWGKNRAEDRFVFLAASRHQGVTKVLLGYGAKTD